MTTFFFRLKILIYRIIGYEKPLRVAALKYLSLKYKQFRPHYETIMLESALEAKRLNYTEITVLELGVGGGNGILSLLKYKKNIEKYCNIKINIYGFDTGKGLPKLQSNFDLPFLWHEGQFDQSLNLDSFKKAKIIKGDIKNSFDELIKYNPKNISAIFFDMDLYSSTANFLNQINKIEKFLSPRVLCYFDDIFNTFHHINEFNGEILAINEFNKSNNNIKIGKSVDNIKDFRFPLAKGKVFNMQKFDHVDYNKYLGLKMNKLFINEKGIKTNNIF